MSAIAKRSSVRLESQPQAKIVADRDGIIREWNSVAERIFGYSAAEAIGQPIDLVVPEEERADHWRSYRRVIATNIINYSPDHILDVEGLRKDGSRVQLDVMLQPIRDSSARIVAITALLQEGSIVSAYQGEADERSGVPSRDAEPRA